MNEKVNAKLSKAYKVKLYKFCDVNNVSEEEAIVFFLRRGLKDLSSIKTDGVLKTYRQQTKE